MISRTTIFHIFFKPSLYLSILLGLAFGMVMYSYWLLDLYPPLSRRILIYTGFLSLTAAILYFFLFEKWLLPRISEMPSVVRLQFLIWSICIGIFLMAAGTTAWEDRSRYLTFLLPSQNLEILVPSQEHSELQSVTISLLRTSLGYVSFDEMDYSGWKRSGDKLVLEDWSDNTLKWKGRTGVGGKIVFKTTLPDVEITASWNGHDEKIILSPEKAGQQTYGHKFYAPDYATPDFVIFLAALNFIMLAAIFNSFLWYKRALLIDKFSESLMYQQDNKENWMLVWGVVLGLFVLALLLRIFNLEILPPYIDEYQHLNAAKDILSRIPINDVYQRGLWIVTLPVVFAFRIWGEQLWVARFIGVIFNSLAVIPLFLLTRRINRPVAILSGVLYASSPWIIATARNVREYAYYPFYFFWILFGLIILIERFPERFSVMQDMGKLFKTRFLSLFLLLLMPFYYGLVIDPDSTFNVILGAYSVSCLFILMKINLKDRVTFWMFALLVLMVLAGLILVLARSSLPVTVTPMRLFFTNPVQQWYYNKNMFIIALVLASAGAVAILFYRINFIPLFILALCVQQLAYFVFFFKRYFRPRYVINVEFWYVVVLAVGAYGIWRFLSAVTPRYITMIAATVLVLLTFNVNQILLPSIGTEAMPMPITVEYHGDVRNASNFLIDRVQREDVLISTYYAFYMHFIGKPVFSEIYPYVYFEHSDDYIMSIVEQHASGWIVLDDTTGIAFLELPRESFMVHDREIEYLGVFGNQLVWNWHILK